MKIRLAAAAVAAFAAPLVLPASHALASTTNVASPTAVTHTTHASCGWGGCGDRGWGRHGWGRGGWGRWGGGCGDCGGCGGWGGCGDFGRGGWW